MHTHLSSSNTWIVAIGLVVVAFHAVASSRLAPMIASFFAARLHRLGSGRP
jgi:hypothetical protein